MIEGRITRISGPIVYAEGLGSCGLYDVVDVGESRLIGEIIRLNKDSATIQVYEDDTVFAFRDIEPQAPTHILIIPKQHIKSAAEITADNSAVVAHIFEVAAVIAKAEGLTDGYRIVNNCGDSAGQTVKHLHFHLMGGRKFGWPAG